MPPLCYFGGAFCPHFVILGALSAPTFILSFIWILSCPNCGGAFCPHFDILGALSAPTLLFWGRFLPPHIKIRFLMP